MSTSKNSHRLTGALAASLLVTGVALAITGQSYIEQDTEVGPHTVIMTSPPPPSKQVTTTTAIQVKQLVVDADDIVYLDGEVSEHSVNTALSQLKKTLRSSEQAYLFIDSPGGSVFDGAKLQAFIEGSRKPVYTVCVGMCASMGFHIFESGKRRFMSTNASLMTHPAAGGLRGTLPEMKSLLEFIERYTAAMDAKVAKRAGLTKDAFELMNLRNTWMTAGEAYSQKFADDIVNIEVTDNLF